MGSLLYAGEEIEFEDRLLAHLQIVILSKLRRRESFALAWRDPLAADNARGAIWLDASIPLHFKYETADRQTINRDWVQCLSDSANSSTGLVVVPEERATIEGLAVSV